jgi:aspartyl-tRNA(Asn)/glutamyl-tRNA(Gln) amidotransferase subunit A
MTTLIELDLVGVAEAIDRGDVSAETVVRWSLERLERYGLAYNAVLRIDASTALQAAREADLARRARQPRGLLDGVPVAHKELFHRAGQPCTSGSLIDRDYVPADTATALRRLDAAGAIDVGTLHLAEFALSPTGHNEHLGDGRNPWNPSHVSGGSSSGSGIAVSTRLVFGSLGSDTGGSIRLPASMCGVTGIKPTHRRVSLFGVTPLAASLDCVGPLAQSARDCARLLRVIAGADAYGQAVNMPVPDYEARLDGSVDGLRIAVPGGYYDEDLAPEIRTALDESLRVFRDAGAIVVETALPDMNRVHALTGVVFAAESASVHRRGLTERPHDYGKQIRARLEPGLHYTATQYIDAIRARTQLRTDYLDAALGDCDVLHLPALSQLVPTINETTLGPPEQIAASISMLTRCTRAINYLGLPALCLPAGVSASGLPIGFQLVGRPFDEATLLKTGDAFQRLTAWHRRMPDAVREQT